MKQLVFVSSLAALLLAGCTEGYQEAHKDIFKDQIWTKGEYIEFHPLIHDAEKAHLISVDLQHIYGYSIDQFDIKVSYTAPSGTVEQEKVYTIRFKDTNGNSLSQCSGDYCDLVQVLEPAFQFKESGEYTIRIDQHTRAESVAGFLSLKLMIQ